MKKNSVMVKKVLMSIVAAGMITFGFTACSENDELSNENASAEMEREYNGPALEPYGLSFQEFITPNDVQILNADTTQISVSKALAEKLGIKSLVGHPMGIWESMNNDSYKNKVSMIPPTGEFKAHAGIGLMLGCDVIVQKLAGPKIAISPKLTADAKLMMSQDPDVLFKFNSSVDFGMAGEIGAKLKVWKWEIADWDTDIDFGEKINIFHYDFPHKEGDTSNGSLDKIMKLLKPFKSDFNR